MPYRTSSTNAANSVDAQAAYETVFSLWGAIMVGGNVIQHAAGWLEGGLVASYEKFALDVDLLQIVDRVPATLGCNEETMGFAAMLEVGPGGHFFGAQHTLERYSTAFYQPIISDWRKLPAMARLGLAHAERRPMSSGTQALAAEYVEPPLAPEIAEEIDAFIARRSEEGGEPTDF